MMIVADTSFTGSVLLFLLKVLLFLLNAICVSERDDDSGRYQFYWFSVIVPTQMQYL